MPCCIAYGGPACLAAAMPPLQRPQQLAASCRPLACRQQPQQAQQVQQARQR